MHDKPITAALYLLVGLLLAVGPILVQLRPTRLAVRSGGVGPGWLARPGAWEIGCAVGLLLGLTLLWWRKLGDGVPVSAALAYLVIVAACLWALSREAGVGKDSAGLSVPLRRSLLAVAVLAAVIGTFGTGVLETPTLKFVAWHHWGAFIAPAEDMKSGGRIFHDFPAQYGLGPTTLLSLVCRRTCWTGMYFSAAMANFILVASGLALIGGLRLKTPLGAAVLLAAAAAAMLLWDANPSATGSPTVTPSVGGLRFLPAAALTAAMWWSESSRRLGRIWAPLGFGLFAVGALWSPESLFMSLTVWGPYYCLRRLSAAAPEARVRTLIVAVAQVAAALIVTAALFLGIYGALFHVLPKPRMYLIYMLFPPGPMAINPLGPIWFCGMALVLGAWTCWRLHREEGNGARFRAGMALLLLAYASMSYAMGRSHDNNFINLLPYFVLVLASVFALKLERLPTGVAAGMMASLLALLPTFSLGAWADSNIEFKGPQVAASMAFSNPQTQAQAPGHIGIDPAALQRVIDTLHSVSKDPVEVIEPDYLDLAGEPVWTSLHGAANFAYIPLDYRVWIAREGTKRFHRDGWLVIHDDMASTWLTSYLPAYLITEERDMEGYRAFHLTPRP